MEFNMVRVPGPSEEDIARIIAAMTKSLLDFGTPAGDPTTMLHYEGMWVAVNGLVWIGVRDEAMFNWSGWIAIIADQQSSGGPLDTVMAFETLDEVTDYMSEFI
jgi:hypothetical protein